jgi:hypothetical protein
MPFDFLKHVRRHSKRFESSVALFRGNTAMIGFSCAQLTIWNPIESAPITLSSSTTTSAGDWYESFTFTSTRHGVSNGREVHGGQLAYISTQITFVMKQLLLNNGFHPQLLFPARRNRGHHWPSLWSRLQLRLQCGPYRLRHSLLRICLRRSARCTPVFLLDGRSNIVCRDPGPWSTL